MSSNRYVQGEPRLGLKSRLIAKAKFRAVTAVPSLNRKPRLTVMRLAVRRHARESAAAAGRSRALLDDGERVERQLGHAQNAELAGLRIRSGWLEVDEAQSPAALRRRLPRWNC